MAKISVLEVLELLNTSYFFPRHPNFHYRRIGIKQKTAPGYPTFEPEDRCEVPISAFVWNESRLNLSVSVNLTGNVLLNPHNGQTASDLGLKERYPVTQFRSFTIIRDGELNVDYIYVRIPDKTVFDTLSDAGLLGEQSFDAEKPLRVDLEGLSIVSPEVLRRQPLLATICEDYLESLHLKAKIKALKWLQTTEVEPKLTTPKTFAESQRALLKSNGVDPETSVYSPPMIDDTSVVATTYKAPYFQVKVKGFNALPKVSAVLQKIERGARLTPAENAVCAGIAIYDDSSIKKMKPHVQDAWFEDTLYELTSRQRVLSKKILEAKFAILIGNFSLFSKQNNYQMTVEDFQFTLTISEHDESC